MDSLCQVFECIFFVCLKASLFCPFALCFLKYSSVQVLQERMRSYPSKTAGNGRPPLRKGALLRAVVRWVKIKLTYSQLHPGGYLFLKSKIESVHMAYTVNLSESGSPFQLKLSLCSLSTRCPQAEVWQWAGFPFWHMECVTFSTCLGGKLPGVYRFLLLGLEAKELQSELDRWQNQ